MILCNNFDFYLQEAAEEEWNELFKEQISKEFKEWEKQEETEAQENQREFQVKQGISLDERQYEKELASYQSVGFRKGKQEFFRCGKCSRELTGAGHHGKAKNRNNPAFWGISEQQYKVLCGNCLEEYREKMPRTKAHTFRKYRRRKQL